MARRYYSTFDADVCPTAPPENDRLVVELIGENGWIPELGSRGQFVSLVCKLGTTPEQARQLQQQISQLVDQVAFTVLNP